jgi:hypothetical protein
MGCESGNLLPNPLLHKPVEEREKIPMGYFHEPAWAKKLLEKIIASGGDSVFDRGYGIEHTSTCILN